MSQKVVSEQDEGVSHKKYPLTPLPLLSSAFDPSAMCTTSTRQEEEEEEETAAYILQFPLVGLATVKITNDLAALQRVARCR